MARGMKPLRLGRLDEDVVEDRQRLLAALLRRSSPSCGRRWRSDGWTCRRRDQSSSSVCERSMICVEASCSTSLGLPAGGLEQRVVVGALEAGVGGDVGEASAASDLAQGRGEGLQAGRVEGRSPPDRAARSPWREGPGPRLRMSTCPPMGPEPPSATTRAEVQPYGALAVAQARHLQREGGLGTLRRTRPRRRRSVRSRSRSAAHGRYLRIPRRASMARRRTRASRSAPGRSTMRRAGSRSHPLGTEAALVLVQAAVGIARPRVACGDRAGRPRRARWPGSPRRRASRMAVQRTQVHGARQVAPPRGLVGGVGRGLDAALAEEEEATDQLALVLGQQQPRQAGLDEAAPGRRRSRCPAWSCMPTTSARSCSSSANASHARLARRTRSR